MKLKSLLTLLLITVSTSAFCTIWTINTSGFTYTPATTNILFGDTVVFTIGGSHDAREVSLANLDMQMETRHCQEDFKLRLEEEWFYQRN